MQAITKLFPNHYMELSTDPLPVPLALYKKMSGDTSKGGGLGQKD